MGRLLPPATKVLGFMAEVDKSRFDSVSGRISPRKWPLRLQKNFMLQLFYGDEFGG